MGILNEVNDRGGRDNRISSWIMCRCAILTDAKKTTQWVLRIGLLILASYQPLAQGADRQLKTAFLYHFCSYVQWSDIGAPVAPEATSSGDQATSPTAEAKSPTTEAKSPTTEPTSATTATRPSTSETPSPSPQNARAHITIGVAAPRSTTQLIKEALEGKYHGKCHFTVRAVRPSDPLTDIQMLYVARNSKFSLENFDALANNPPILTITDEEKGSSRAIITFLIRNNHIRFTISKSRADQTGIKLSSELLAVALRVN